MRPNIVLLTLAAGLLLRYPGFGQANEPDPLPALLDAPDHTFVNAPAPVSTHRMALGINYTGAQFRWNFRSRWAVEGRYQQGSATSDYGNVKSKVFGVRAYRFFRTERRFPLYIAPEIARATATPERSDYRVDGFAAGVAGGMEYHVTPRISLDVDIGPYVIALHEKKTQVSQSSLDFVLNTALLVHLF